MANQILNENNFDRIIDNLAKRWTKAERAEVNKAGEAVFTPMLKKKVDVHRTPGKGVGYPGHMADTLDNNVRYDGSVEIGFTKKGKKAYIARFLNDGWEEHNQHGGPYGHREGEHFWEETTTEAEEPSKKAMAEAAKQVMRKKAEGY